MSWRSTTCSRECEAGTGREAT